MDLRPYQTGAIDQLRVKIRQGKKRLLLVAPTGSGKTVIASHLIASAVEKGSAILFLAHRTEILEQTSAKLDQLGIPHGVVQASHPRWMPWLPVQVASVPTLARRLGSLSLAVQLIFVDEAHHARANSYQQILQAYPQAPVVGLTATPWRIDGKGLGHLFEDLVVAATPRELTDKNFLVPANGFAFEMPSLDGVRITAGDYNEGELEAAVNKPKLVGNYVARWQQHAEGLRTVVFAVSIEHSKAIVQAFTDAGIPAEHLDGTTDKDERTAILARLKAGTTKVVSNCAVLTEGWDCPEIECAILARPTKSLTLYLQMVGRALRPAPWIGKHVARIHDHAGATLEHGLPTEDRDYSLTSDWKRAKKRETESSVRVCKQCFATYDARMKFCPNCGEPVPIKSPLPEELDDAQLITLEDVAARRRALPGQKAFLEALVEKATAKGYKAGWVGYQFKAKFGTWPRLTEAQRVSLAKAREDHAQLQVFGDGAIR